MKELEHFINGKRVEGKSGRFGDVFNPATGEIQSKAPFASADEVDIAVQGALAAQPAWAALNPQRRARVMLEFVHLLKRDMDKLAAAISSETRKNPSGRARRRAARLGSR